MTFWFDGVQLEATDGQTIAAALIAAGHRVFRRTRVEAAPRGLFCGIGICFDCLVLVNGHRRVRACMTSVQQGDVVSTLQGAGDGERFAEIG